MYMYISATPIGGLVSLSAKFPSRGKKNKLPRRFTGRLTFQWPVKGWERDSTNFSDIVDLSSRGTIPESERRRFCQRRARRPHSRAHRRQGRRGRRRRPLVAGRCGRLSLMYSDVDGKPVKRPHAGLPGDLLAPVINGPVTFTDVTGVAERKLTTHPSPPHFTLPERYTLTPTFPPAASFVFESRISSEIKNGCFTSGSSPHRLQET